MSNLLRFLMTKERWERFALSLTKIERIAQKTEVQFGLLKIRGDSGHPEQHTIKNIFC